MTLIRWCSFLLAAECMFGLWVVPRSAGSALLAILFLTFFLIYCWSVRDLTNRKANS